MASWLRQASLPAVAVSAHAAATDGLGNTVVAGRFQGAWSLGQLALDSPEANAAFVAKVDPLGTPLWVVSALPSDPGSWVESASTAVDAGGNVVVAGLFAGSLTLAGTTAQGAGSQNMWVAKLSPLGALLWLHAYGSPAGIAVSWNIALGPSGQVALVGYHSGGTDFGGGPVGVAGTPATFLLHLDADGVYVRDAEHGVNDWQLALAFSSNAELVVAGPLGRTLVFDGTELTNTGLSTGNPDIFLAKLNANGQQQWSQRFGSEGSQTISAVALDPVTSEVVIAGWSASSFDLGGLPIAAKGLTTAFVAKLNAQGVSVWANAWGGHEAFGTTVALGPNGDVLVGGSFSGALDVGEGLTASPLERRLWLARLTNQGTVQWAKQSTGVGIHGLHAVAFDPDGDVRAVVSFAGQVAIDGLMSDVSETPSFFAARIPG